ncbi:sensor histidine kinase [Amnibacterium endophyticum]|uniref:histidine kinase n=1 Tax=Amnibacterium endophyticum TaxID=2109337 RepID=A0ABW4LHD6_9MICO
MTRVEDPDARSVRIAARRTGIAIAGVSAAIVVGILGLAALFVVYQSRPSELLEPAAPGETKIYVDSKEMLLALAVLGALAVAVVGVAAWWISRRSVAPLGAVLRMQRAFVADASHELRTPLAVLDVRLQGVQAALDRGDPVGDDLGAARRDVGAMAALVTDLLLAAEQQAASADEECDLRPAVEGATADLAALAAEHGVRLVADVRNEARLRLPEAALKRAVVVLVDNAVQHSPAGARVEVEARVVGRRAVVRVRDEGDGIRGIDVDRLFERFARGEAIQRRGSGLGLALVRDLAVRHGGEIAVERTSAAGTVMRLELPVARPARA